MMCTAFRFFCAVLVIGGLMAMSGCGGSKPAEKKPTKSGHYEGDGHDHSKDNRDKGEKPK